MLYKGFHYDCVDSTNEVAKRLITDGAILASLPERGLTSEMDAAAYVVAQEQTAGRGTRGRRWVSPRHAGLYLSIIHLSGDYTSLSRQPLALTSLYTQAAGVACVETLKTLFNLEIQLKPVNDLYVCCPQSRQYKKLGGILTESLVQENTLKALVTGIGINLAATERILEPILDPTDHASEGISDALPSDAYSAIVPVSLEELLSAQMYRQLEQPLYKTELIETLIRQVCQQYAKINTPTEAEMLAQYQAFQIELRT